MPDPRNKLPWKATVKAHPAIGDMQAVEEMIRQHVAEPKGATPHIVELYTVPADKIFMLSMLYATHSGVTVTSITVDTVVAGTGYPLAFWAHTANWETHTWFGSLPLNEGEIIRWTWTGGAAGGTVIGAMMGYLINKYA